MQEQLLNCHCGQERGGGGGFVRANKSIVLRKVCSKNYTMILIIPVNLLVFVCELHVHIIVN